MGNFIDNTTTCCCCDSCIQVKLALVLPSPPGIDVAVDMWCGIVRLARWMGIWWRKRGQTASLDSSEYGAASTIGIRARRRPLHLLFCLIEPKMVQIYQLSLRLFPRLFHLSSRSCRVLCNMSACVGARLHLDRGLSSAILCPFSSNSSHGLAWPG